jgi:hypothetical protein
LLLVCCRWRQSWLVWDQKTEKSSWLHLASMTRTVV